MKLEPQKSGRRRSLVVNRSSKFIVAAITTKITVANSLRKIRSRCVLLTISVDFIQWQVYQSKCSGFPSHWALEECTVLQHMPQLMTHRSQGLQKWPVGKGTVSKARIYLLILQGKDVTIAWEFCKTCFQKRCINIHTYIFLGLICTVTVFCTEEPWNEDTRHKHRV